MAEKSHFHGEEPALLPVTDFAMDKGIGSFDDLNDSRFYMRDSKFIDALKRALENSTSFESGRKEACNYYVVHLDVRIDNKPVGFVVKVLHRDLEERFEEIEEQYEILQVYCPHITLPTLFVRSTVAGSVSRLLSIQKEITDGVTITEYVKMLKETGEKVPERVIAELRELLAGMRKLLANENRQIDDRTIDPTAGNVLVSPQEQQLWVIDNNHIIDVVDDEHRREYEQKLNDLEAYISNLE